MNKNDDPSSLFWQVCPPDKGMVPTRFKEKKKEITDGGAAVDF
jgi:hypothetical protein